jgi:hypothetical protein
MSNQYWWQGDLLFDKISNITGMRLLQVNHILGSLDWDSKIEQLYFRLEKQIII